MIRRTLTLTALAAVLAAQTTFAETEKAPSKRFTAERVFDIEYATDPQNLAGRQDDCLCAPCDGPDCRPRCRLAVEP